MAFLCACKKNYKYEIKDKSYFPHSECSSRKCFFLLCHEPVVHLGDIVLLAFV